MDSQLHKNSDRAFDRKLAHILSSAARIFAQEGYGGASIRKVAAHADVSLAGLYHYVRSKEELLYLIQLHTFRSLVDNLQRTLVDLDDPVDRFRAAVRNHTEHFVAHMDELRVCAVELDTLTGEYYEEVAEVRRDYFKVMLEVVSAVRDTGGERAERTRLATLSVFGTLNWLFQWYDPERDPDAETLADEFTTLFTHGFLPPEP